MNFHTILTAASLEHDSPRRGNAGAQVEARAPEPFGPPTSSDMTAAGGPFNRWDIDISAAEARGNRQLAQRLRDARARVNIHLLGRLEPVWVPTPHQRTMLALRAEAAVNGFAAVAA